MYGHTCSSMVCVPGQGPAAAMTNSQIQTGPRGSGDAAVAEAEFASSLQGLLDVSRAVRSGADVGSVLDTIAGAVSKTLGFESVVLNVYRPEWDDFYVQTVYGSALVRKALLGQIYDWDSWKPLLHQRFLRGGAYFIPNDAFDWSTDTGTRYVPDGEPLVDGPQGWHPNDELFVPLERSDGEILGIMSFGEPRDGLRPTDRQLALAVTLASHAALALEMAQERKQVERHQRGLEQLLRVSSQLPQTMTTEAILTSVCEAVREALGFDKVLIELRDEGNDLLRPAASAGFDESEEARNAVLELSRISRLFDRRFEIAGCYLVPRDEAERRVDPSQVVYESSRNGRGPAAWNHHWLVVPLYDTDGTVRGVLWADEPQSRLLPTENVLQALRIFANHAMEALAVATQLAETRFLADHDPLTRLLNRRTLLHELQETEELRSLALVFLDLDNFKEINDRHGHVIGDRVLEKFGSLLEELVRDEDHAFRVGGDEFALLLRGAGEPDAREVVARIIEAVESNIDPLVRMLTASFGIATSGRRQEPEELLRIADEAMYQAKRSGTRIEVAA
jgi:diguanylate cyclase (GGDEF)-like protein